MFSPRIERREDNDWDSARHLPPPPPKSTEPWPYWVLPGSLEFKVLLQLGAPWQSERAWGSPGSSFTPSLLPCVRMWSKDEAAPLCKFL